MTNKLISLSIKLQLKKCIVLIQVNKNFVQKPVSAFGMGIAVSELPVREMETTLYEIVESRQK
jgi:hypothetical protein